MISLNYLAVLQILRKKKPGIRWNILPVVPHQRHILRQGATKCEHMGYVPQKKWMICAERKDILLAITRPDGGKMVTRKGREKHEICNL